ncbi:microsomal signal peptidase 25 kDa subunit-domain-containing protein [Cladochytrium replicatum]|nr:microsomal signal peptidase 25 kDa subunit-domain-containing protein [Cladochytrium replicatum]
MARTKNAKQASTADSDSNATAKKSEAVSGAVEVDGTTQASSLFLEDAAKNPLTINHYNGAEVKHTLDDAVRRILVDDYSFVENFKHVDTRLLLGYLAVVCAGFGTLYSYLVPFPKCKPVLAVSVVAYFIFNGLMMLFASFVEKDTVFMGVKKDASRIDPDVHATASSELKRFSSDYSLTINISKGGSHHEKGKGSKSAKSSHISLKRNIGVWFDVEGRFAADAFYRDFTSQLSSDFLKQN